MKITFRTAASSLSKNVAVSTTKMILSTASNKQMLVNQGSDLSFFNEINFELKTKHKRVVLRAR